MKVDDDIKQRLDTNINGVYTEPFKWYWIKHSMDDKGETLRLATRVRNSWEYFDRKFATYNQFVTEAKLATEEDLAKATNLCG